jgi:tetratricopeptide (TPR) repeat protein
MNYFSQFGDWVLLFVEQLSNWKPDPQHRDQLQYLTATLSVLTGLFAVNRARITALRFLGRGKTLSADEQVLADHIAENSRSQIDQAIAELKQSLANKQAGTKMSGALPSTAANPNVGLALDLDTAIATLLAAGRADTLIDKSGAAAEAALDALINERTKARQLIANDEAALWRQKGAVAFLQDTKRGVAAYTRATELAPNNAVGWNRLGDLLLLDRIENLGDNTHAIRAYSRATELDPGNADGWNRLGHLLSRVGKQPDAERAFGQALTIYEANGNQEMIAITSGNLGLVARTQGKLDVAEAMYRKALMLNEKLGRQHALANQNGKLGEILRKRGDLEGAALMHFRSLELNEALDNNVGMAAAYGSLGDILQEQGNLDRAEVMQRKCLALNELVGSIEGVSAANSRLGFILDDMGKNDEAEAMFSKVRAAQRHKEETAINIGHLAVLFQPQEELEMICAGSRS